MPSKPVGMRRRRSVYNNRRVIDTIKDRPCYDCGEWKSKHRMTYDHLPQYEKKFNIAGVANKKTLRAILEEILKCDIVCRNCHDVREKQEEMQMDQPGEPEMEYLNK